MMILENLPEVSLPLPWHAECWAHLGEQLAAGRLPHALLLTGEQHTGKSQLALSLSRLLLCASPIGGLNCGKCHACELSASGGHGDFSWVQPAEKSRTIKIDQVRGLVQFTTMTAGFGARKVIVLAPADSMNVNAFNALLKSLEEPSADTYLLLVCHRLHNVPATIRSRCQLVRMPLPAQDDSLRWLDQVTGQRPASEKLLSLAEGRPLFALQLYESDAAEEFAARRTGIAALLDGLVTVPQAAGAWSDVDALELLEQLTQEIQGIVRMLSVQQLQSKAGRASFQIMDELGRLQRAVTAGANPNKQLLVDSILSKMDRLLGGGQLGDNIQRKVGDSSV
jgi:DNA polymerase-3 subunit delta'